MMKRFALMVIALCLLIIFMSAMVASAQTTVIKAVDPSAGTTTDVGDAANNALRMNCVNGCSSTPATVVTGTLSSAICPGTGCVELTTSDPTGTVFVEWTPSSWNPVNDPRIEGGATSATVQNVSCSNAGTSLSTFAVVLSCQGYPYFRVRSSAYVNGTAAVRLVSSPVSYSATTVTLAFGSTVAISSGVVSIPGGVTASQGLPGSNANSWWTQIGDGTNGPATVSNGIGPAAGPALLVQIDGTNSSAIVGSATSNNQINGSQRTKLTDGTNNAAVKAASTAALAADPALVVAISPNNTPVLPNGAASSSGQTTGNNSLASIDLQTSAISNALINNRTAKIQITDGTRDGTVKAAGVLPSAGSDTAVVVTLRESLSTAVTGPLTDTQLRATPVPVSGTVATGGLTDTQLRATPVPVSGTITATGPLTDTQLRATPVPISVASLPLPSTASTSTLQTTGNSSLTNIESYLGSSAGGIVPLTTNDPTTGGMIVATQSTAGTSTPPTRIDIVGGKSNDGTPKYYPVPEGALGRSVIVEGIAGGTAVPVSMDIALSVLRDAIVAQIAASQSLTAPATSSEAVGRTLESTPQNLPLPLSQGGGALIIATAKALPFGVRCNALRRTFCQP